MKMQQGKTFKTLFAAVLAAVIMQADNASAQITQSADDAVKAMRVGWNYGNALDCNSGDVNNMWIEKWSGMTPKEYETAWGQSQASPKLFQMLHDAGFNAVRVPVTWYPHMKGKKWKLNNLTWSPTDDPISSKVDADWMARVKEVVDQVLASGMYCIINVHHDTGAATTAWIRANGNTFSAKKSLYEALWKQIAEEFKGYGDHLLFEGYNEMLDGYSSWCFASFAASGQYNQSSAEDSYKAINDYAQTFVNTVRATGGNNSTRNLIVNTYGSCDGRGNWNSHLVEPLSKMKLPADKAKGHLIFEVHTYPDMKNLQNARNEVDAEFSSLKKNLVSKGAPVIIGEWGASDGTGYDTDYKNNLLDFAKYFVAKAKKENVATFYWMGISDGADRAVPRFTQADLRDAIIKGYYGDGGYTAVSAPEVSSVKKSNVIYNILGQRVDDFCKPGLYIVNGKKVLKK